MGGVPVTLRLRNFVAPLVVVAVAVLALLIGIERYSSGDINPLDIGYGSGNYGPGQEDDDDTGAGDVIRAGPAEAVTGQASFTR
jgi:hypothetical protein